jgi:type I restriction enzyme S subunit
MSNGSSWPVLSLAGVCVKIQDGTHFSPKVQFAEPGLGRFKYLTSKNIRPWGVDLSDITYVSEETHREIYRRCDPQHGDVLLTKDGVNTGTVAVNSLDEEFSLLSSVAILRPRRDILDSRFLRYFIESPQGSRNILGKMSGTAIRRIILKRIKEATIPLPPLEEQQLIVAEIEKQFTRLDAGVASLKRVQTELKRYRASVLKAACEGRLVPTEAELARKENRSYESGEELLQRILKERREKWNGKGKYKEPKAPEPLLNVDLPEGWTWTGFEQLADGSKHAIKAGPFGSSLKKSVYTSSGFKIYGQEQVIRGDPYFGDYFISRELFEQLQSCEAKPGDILVSLVGTAGKVLILPDDSVRGIINPRLLKLSLNRSGVNSKFIKILLESSAARGFFKLAAHGGTMEILNLGILKAFPVPLPPLSEQTRIAAEVERRLSVVDELELAVRINFQHTGALRRSILKRAFTEPKRL